MEDMSWKKYMEYDQTDIMEVMGEASSPDDTLITLDSRGKKVTGKPEKGRVMSYRLCIYILTIWEGRGGEVLCLAVKGD